METITFSGYNWNVFEGAGFGGNTFDADNAWVDEHGWLHLKITSGDWNSAHMWTTETFGFGKFEFWVKGRIDNFHDRAILGMFLFPHGDPEGEGVDEIDIEIAGWDPGKINANYAVYATKEEPALRGQHRMAKFYFSLGNDYSYHWFERSERKVVFASFGRRPGGGRYQLCRWSYDLTHAEDYDEHISQREMPVYLNLWIKKDRLEDGTWVVPAGMTDHEVTIRRFRYQPL